MGSKALVLPSGTATAATNRATTRRTTPPRRLKAPPTQGVEVAGVAREEAMAAEDKVPKEGVEEDAEGAAVTLPLNHAGTTTTLVHTRAEMAGTGSTHRSMTARVHMEGLTL